MTNGIQTHDRTVTAMGGAFKQHDSHPHAASPVRHGLFVMAWRDPAIFLRWSGAVAM